MVSGPAVLIHFIVQINQVPSLILIAPYLVPAMGAVATGHANIPTSQAGLNTGAVEKDLALAGFDDAATVCHPLDLVDVRLFGDVDLGC
jgi:hypothetical protein